MTSEGDPSRPTDAGPEFATLLEKLSADQDARKTSLEQRGIAVITTSGTLVTLLFALVAVVTKAADFELPRTAQGPLGVALGGFVLAAVLALLTNVPLLYANVRAKEAGAQIWDQWYAGRNKALREITATRLGIVARAQLVNGIKAWLLIAALVSEVVGVGGVALAVREVLRS